MAKKFHIKKNGDVGPCTARNTCPLGEDVPHFDNKQDAEKYITEKSEKEFDNMLFGKLTKDSVSNSKGIKDKRVYELYKKERSIQRNSNDLHEQSGSRFNNSVGRTAKALGITMDEAKNGIYKQYALDKKITEKQAREHFENAKDSRVQNYENNQEYRAASEFKHKSYDDYRNYVKTFDKLASGPEVEAFVRESKRIHPEHFTNTDKRNELKNSLSKEVKKNNEIDKKFYEAENFAKIRLIVTLEDIDKKK